MDKPILYIDMDGVVADFVNGIQHYHKTIFQDYSGELLDQQLDRLCQTEDCKHVFADLPFIDGALDAVKQLSQSYNIYFLSTPMWGCPESFTDKRIWLANHFGTLATKRLILTHRKDLCIGDYLIDDRLTNGVSNFKGKHIHFGSDAYPNWSAVLHYFESIK